MTTSKNDLVAGFDPGGKNSFGWCVVAVRPRRKMIDAGKNLASNADDAFCKASQVIKSHGGSLRAVGIDAPLTWARNGGQRTADRHINNQHSPNSALSVNSLWGACAVQGFLLAEALSREYPGILFTEANPKPLKDNPDAIKWYKDVWSEDEPDHIRDAIVSAWAAAQALKAYGKGWKGQVGLNLYDCDDKAKIYHFPFFDKNKNKVVYWWPKKP